MGRVWPILAGLSVAFAVGLLAVLVFIKFISPPIASDCGRSLGLLAGGLMAGYLCIRQGWLYGAMVGIFEVCLFAIILSMVAYHASGNQVSWAIRSFAEPIAIVRYAFDIIAAIVGGHVGEMLKSRRRARISQEKAA